MADPRVRVDVTGSPRWGALRGDRVFLDGGGELAAAAATFLAPVEPTKIIATHLTYRSRVEEYRARVPAEPSYFMKPPSTLNGHRGLLRRPRGARFLNYEGEVAAVIGRPMHGVPESEVLDYVAGYAPANDVGLHDFRHADRGSMLRVKGQDGFCPIGPGLVRGIDPRPSAILTYVNGKVVQEGRIGDMDFGIDYLLADLCRHITLLPGDVILSGTPANSRPMANGDIVEVEIEGIGRLTNHVVERPAPVFSIGHQPTDSTNVRAVALGLGRRGGMTQ